MGSGIEINDTLKLSRGAGFPAPLEVGGEYSFRKDGRRLYHLAPTRVFLVEDVDDLWNIVGEVEIVSLTIDARSNETSGTFRVLRLYPEELRVLANAHMTPAGKGLR